MKRNLFTVLLLLSVGIALPGMWRVILAPKEISYVQEENANQTDGEGEIPPEENPLQEENSLQEETGEQKQESEGAEAEKDFTSVDTSYWSDALFIGDSRTVGLSEYADLGEADVFAYSGMSVYTVFQVELEAGQSGKQTLEELLTEREYGKIYIMMGINELGYDYNATVKKYQELVERIHELQPQAILFLEANLHVTKKKSDSERIYNNPSIDRINQAIEELADNKIYFYIDVNELFDDGQGNLDVSYTADEAHVLGKHYVEWAEWLLKKGIVS